jgi:hypothetical protein
MPRRSAASTSGVAAVTNAFLSLLRRSAKPRIVNVQFAHVEYQSEPTVQIRGQRRRGVPIVQGRHSNAFTVLYTLELTESGVKMDALSRPACVPPTSTRSARPAAPIPRK